MADGSYKNIADIRAGDLVRSYDTSKKKLVSSLVTNTFHHTKEEMGSYYLTVMTAKGRVMRVTPNHPIFIDGGWRRADHLKVGDQLFDGKSKDEITSISTVYRQVLTYNLEVMGTHDYFADDILVHNKVNLGQ